MNAHKSSDRIRRKVKAEKTVYTFAFLGHIGSLCREQVTGRAGGQNPYLAASMIFSAFSVEAYLNHLGANVTSFWPAVELKLSPAQKLHVLLKVLHAEVDFGKRPFQSFVAMFQFRNALAHGKTEKLHQESYQVLSDGDDPRLPMTNWEAKISSERATIFLEDSNAIMEFLNEKAGFEPYSLSKLSEYSWSSTP